MIVFNKLKERLKGNEALAKKYLPYGVRKGNELVCGDIFGAKGESFSYNIVSGVWCDFANEDQAGASLIDLISMREGIPFKMAAEMLANDVGGSGDYTPMKVRERENDKRLIIAPMDAPVPENVYRNNSIIPIVKSWCYRNQKGYPMAYDCRIEQDGKKEIIPHIWKDGAWKQGALPDPRPLYNLDKIFEFLDKTIVVVEGCKTADASTYYFPNYISTSWQNGAQSVKKADFSPLYGRKIILIPDADKAGIDAMNKVAEILSDNGCAVRIVDTSSKAKEKKGWDVADAFEQKIPQADVVDFIKENIYDYKPEHKLKDKEIVDVEVIVEKERKKLDYDHTYFKCLGVIDDTHFYYHKKSGQIIDMTPSKYDSKRLIGLAPLAYWQVSYPSKSGIDWLQACDDLCRIQESIGIFNPDCIRGCGAWFDDNRSVIHLGTSMLVDGIPFDIEQFKSKYIYKKKSPIAVKLQTSLPVEESRKLIDVLRLCRWERPYYGDILAGWMFSALVCGAMTFRSHLYLIGAAGTGKSWIIENIVKEVMGEMALFSGSKNTESGIRNKLDNNIVPVIIDEAEAENIQDKARVQAIFDLSRQASSEKASAIIKGRTGGGGSISYICRSAFMFASINNSMSKSADLSRTTFIKLKNSPNKRSREDRQEDAEAFSRLEKATSRLIDSEYCRCLTTRAVKMIPTLRESHKIIAEVCAKEFGSRRLGDQLGMVLAGIWGLRSDYVINFDEAFDLIKEIAIQEEKSEQDEQSQEELAFDKLMFSEIFVQNTRCLLSNLISLCYGTTTIKGISKSESIDYLASQGILIKDDGMVLSTRDQALPAKLFKDSEWSYGWRDALMRLEGTERKSNTYFCATLKSRGIFIPVGLFIKDNLI